MTATFGLLAEGPPILVDDTSAQPHTLREAADPETSPWRLATLAHHLDPGVRMAVATNPSSPALTMLRLRGDLDPGVQVVMAACQVVDR